MSKTKHFQNRTLLKIFISTFLQISHLHLDQDLCAGALMHGDPDPGKLMRFYLTLVGSAVAAVLGNLGNRLQRLVTAFYYLHSYRNNIKSTGYKADEYLPQMSKKNFHRFTSHYS
jgi:hypothetical protein